ncbi:hypothetical protein [Halegenticoccus soli]|nr:hypothetical protein [Halegenticoccus soli]
MVENQYGECDVCGGSEENASDIYVHEIRRTLTVCYHCHITSAWRRDRA